MIWDLSGGPLGAAKGFIDVKHENVIPQSDFRTGLEEECHRRDLLLQASNRSLAHATKELNSAGRELTKINQSFKALMNSLGQGFLVFDQAGVCGRVFSEICIELLEGDPVGRHIADILQVPDDKRETFLGWIELLYSNTLDFEDLAALGPKVFPSLMGRQIELEFKPILGEEGEVVSVVMFATDLTAEIQAKEEAQRKQNYVDMIIKITKDRNQFVLFIKKVREIISMLANYSGDHKEVNLGEIRRQLHTVKGGAASFYIQSIKNLAHQFESEIGDYIHNTGANEDVSASHAELLPKIENYGVKLEMELANFLTEHQKMLGEDFEKEGYVKKLGINHLLDFAKELQALPGAEAVSMTFLRDLVAVPVSQFFMQFDSVVQSTANRMGKKVKTLEFSGDDVGILPHLYEDFFATMIHIFTNSVAHGIELPDDRAMVGKNKVGSIVVKVVLEKGESQPDWLDIRIEDDGQGVSPQVIRTKLKKLGQVQEAESETDAEIIQHIFDGGFSTKDIVTDLAGRGVGLSALKEEVIRLGGTVRVDSTVGKQTNFHLRLPYLWKGKLE